MGTLNYLSLSTHVELIGPAEITTTTIMLGIIPREHS